MARDAAATARRRSSRNPHILCAAVLLAAVLLAAGCGRDGPAWKQLPASPDQAYEVSVRTFNDGAYADQPFHLRIRSRRPPGHEIRVLAASQCENVKVLQRPDFLYIFYDELALSGFSSSQFAETMPRPFLCDLRHGFCSARLDAALGARETVSDVCTYTGPAPA